MLRRLGTVWKNWTSSSRAAFGLVMSLWEKFMSAHHEIEIYPDSGISERGHDVPRWLLAVAVFFLGYMMANMNWQFWDQSEELPFYGPGWEIHDQYYTAVGEDGGYYDHNFAEAGIRKRQPSEVLTEAARQSEPYMRSAGALVKNDYGISR